MAGLQIESRDIFEPTLVDLVPILEEGLKKNFRNVKIGVVDCPKLNEAPFHLAGEGLCGNTSIIDVGGPPYLIPRPRKDKHFKFEDILNTIKMDEALIIGPGAGPSKNVGINCEMMANISRNNGQLLNKSRICKTTDSGYKLEELKIAEFDLMANLFCSEGKPGKVLEIMASDRTGGMNYMSCIRQTLKGHYNDKPVGLGGLFLIEKGKAKIHVMPKFSEEPLRSDEDVENWLRFFEMNAPLICVGELVSHDPGLDLRTEHFHCFSMHGDGGHYHYDITPEEVVYRGYFNVARRVHRIDRPQVTHKIGRD